MVIVTSLVALCAFALACYGWGSAAYALFYPGRDPSHAYIITLGLAVLAFVGGILNAFHTASTLHVAICAYVGILLSGFFVVRLGSSIKWRSVLAPPKLPELAYAIVSISSGIFLIVTLLPTSPCLPWPKSGACAFGFYGPNPSSRPALIQQGRWRTC